MSKILSNGGQLLTRAFSKKCLGFINSEWYRNQSRNAPTYAWNLIFCHIQICCSILTNYSKLKRNKLTSIILIYLSTDTNIFIKIFEWLPKKSNKAMKKFSWVIATVVAFTSGNCHLPELSMIGELMRLLKQGFALVVVTRVGWLWEWSQYAFDYPWLKFMCQILLHE